MTFFGNRIFADDQVKMGPNLISSDFVFRKRRNLNPSETRRLCGEHEDRDQDDVSMPEGTPQAAAKHKKVEERHRTNLPQGPQKKLTLMTP